MTPADFPWYEDIPNGERPFQGELVFDCPIIRWKDRGWNPEDDLTTVTEVALSDVIVMSQDCDIENRHIIRILLCPHTSLSSYRQVWEEVERARGNNPSMKAWARFYEEVKQGKSWPLTMLNDLPEPWADKRIVNFREAYTLPVSFLQAYLNTQQRRLYLRPPYREHLSQSFARFYMRVGLPTAIN